MSEWLTMNELLNKMEFGDNAINNHNQEVHMDGAGYLVYTANDKRMRVCKQVMKDKWRILPKFISFKEAIKALDEGKTVYFQGSYGWNEKVTPKDYESICFEHSPIKDHGLQDIVKGKWTIED